MGYFLSLFVLNPSGGSAAKKAIFFVSFNHRSQSHLKFQSCLTTEYAWVCFWMSKENFSWNPPEQYVVMLGLFDIFFLGFLIPRLNQSLQFSSCNRWRVFGHSNSPPHHAIGWYRHTSSSRQICNIFRWLEPLYYCPDGGNVDFQCFSSFLLQSLSIL